MRIWVCLLALVFAACSGSVVAVSDGGAGDASAGDGAADAASGDVNACAPGMCKLTPVAMCEAPSGPTGNGCCRCMGDECAMFCK